MLYYDRIDISVSIDFNKASMSKNCIFCRYWYFSDKGFTFQSHICNGCHNILIMFMKLSNFPILNIHGVDYR